MSRQGSSSITLLLLLRPELDFILSSCNLAFVEVLDHATP